MKLCNYGCGQQAQYFKDPTQKCPDGRAMCAPSPNSCPAKRAKTKGDNNPSRRPEVRQKISKINSVLFASGSEYRQKCKKTLISQHGVENPMHIPNVVKKVVTKRRAKNNYKRDPLWLNSPEANAKRKQTRIARGLDLPEESFSEFRLYERQVDVLTEQNYEKYKTQINPNDLVRGRIKGTYQLDHTLSKVDGFKQSVLPKDLAHPANLRMLTIEENISKGPASDITVKQLMESIKKYNKYEHEI
jgi:hypothetical protein